MKPKPFHSGYPRDYDARIGGFLAGSSLSFKKSALVTPVPLWFVALSHNHVLASVVAFIANYGIALTTVALLGAAWVHRDRPALLIPFLIGAMVASVLDIAAGRTYYELRPFAVMHTAPLVPYDPRDNSFPSDHAVATAFVAAFLFFVDVRFAVVATAAALIVGEARMIALLHWPHDVVIGWVIGAWCGIVAGVLAPQGRVQSDGDLKPAQPAKPGG